MWISLVDFYTSICYTRAMINNYYKKQFEIAGAVVGMIHEGIFGSKRTPLELGSKPLSDMDEVAIIMESNPVNALQLIQDKLWCSESEARDLIYAYQNRISA